MKKSKSLLVPSVLIAMCLLAAVTLSGCGDPEYTVKYEITGPAMVASYVLYKNSTGGWDQPINVNIPWSYTMTVSGKLISLGCSVHLPYSNTDTYTAKIFVNGKEEKSSSGTTSVSAAHVIQ
jgi:hypothetical protein